jgi:outer membrane immunogenic protein
MTARLSKLSHCLIGAAASASLSVGSAFAADIPTKAPVAPQAWSWAGFYLGAHGGYGWKKNDFTDVFIPPFAIDGIRSEGSLFGGHAGYNWQYGRWVAGFELDVSAANLKGTSNAITFPSGLDGTATHYYADDVKYLGTARARVGVAPFAGCCWNALLYGTAGLAWERVNRTTTEINTGFGPGFTRIDTLPRDHFGWVAGAGGELQIASSNWIARVEYLHSDFGTVEQTTHFISASTDIADKGGRQTIDVVRAALSYKFGSTP